MSLVRQFTKSVPQLIEAGMTERNVTAEALAEALNVNVQTIKLLRSGIVRLPLANVSAFSGALGLEERQVMRALLHDMDPKLPDVVEKCFAPYMLSPEEVQIIQRLRVANQAGESASGLFERDSVAAPVMPSVEGLA